MKTLTIEKKATMQNVAKKVRNSALALAGMVETWYWTSIASHASGFDNVTVTANGGEDAGALMGKVIGILLTITRFAGVGLVVFGVYEIVMSFMQQQPEAKTKGIIMALAGIVMIALKTILGPSGIGIISQSAKLF